MPMLCERGQTRLEIILVALQQQYFLLLRRPPPEPGWENFRVLVVDFLLCALGTAEYQVSRFSSGKGLEKASDISLCDLNSGVEKLSSLHKVQSWGNVLAIP
jgi:hypothetical protein